MGFSLFSKKDKFLGIDVGTFSIKVVEMSKKGKQATLENYGEVATKDISNMFLKEDEEEKLKMAEKATADSIKYVIKEAGMKARESFFSVPNFTTFFTTFSLPPMEEEEVESSIKYQAKKHIPLSPSEVFLDWSVEKEKNNERKVSLVAVPNDVVQRYQRIAKQCGLDINVLEMESFSLKRCLNQSKKKISVVMDIGFSGTGISAIENGKLKVTHRTTFSGSMVTEELARGLNLIYNEKKANKIKESEGMKGKNREIIAPLVDELIKEMSISFTSYIEKDTSEIEEIVLCGGGSLLPGLREYIAEKTGIETRYMSPDFIKYPSYVKEFMESEVGPIFSVAIGAALYSTKK